MTTAEEWVSIGVSFGNPYMESILICRVLRSLKWVRIGFRVQDLEIYFTAYVYDSIVAEGSAEEAWRQSQRVGSIWKYLGLKYPPWKRSMVGKYGVP